MLINKKKYITFISTIVAMAIFMTACSFDFDKAGKAFVHLGENLDEAVNGSEVSEEVSEEPAETTVIEVEDEDLDEEVEEEIIEEEENEDDAVVTEPDAAFTLSPESTPTPTPTPEPEATPERVDFSELTEDTLTDDITVESEEFSESYVNEDEVTMAMFEGTRLLISSEEIPSVQIAVNLMLDGFYQEALGVYNRCTNDMLAEYEMNDEEENEEFIPTLVTVNYTYGFNGRVLSVAMTYVVSRDEEVVSEYYEEASFDLYTGSYVTMNDVISDTEAFVSNAGELLAFVTEDEEDTAADFTDISIFARDDRETIYILGTAPDGTRVRALADLETYGEFFTRFGRIIYC